MIPLQIRTNRLLSIHIRAINLEYTKYTLQILTNEGNSYIFHETERTMVIIIYI